ncbi:hypothetical protein C8Q76DRAFT_573020, partial [Earliella scabrosa]
ALIIYEHILTAQQEYQVIWKRKLSLPIVLYILNRYILLGVGGLYIFCSNLVWLPMDHVRPAHFPALMALRIHAINNQNWCWTVMTLLLGLLSVPPLHASIFATTMMNVVEHLYSTFLTLTVTVAVRISRIVQDIIVLGITWYRTFGTLVAARRAHVHTSVVSVLLRDGQL